MTKQADTVEMATWPEAARRYVKKQEKALELCRAERAHYASIVEEHEYKWDEQELMHLNVEALGTENYKLKAECEKLRAQLALAQNPASDSAMNPIPLENADNGKPKNGVLA